MQARWLRYLSALLVALLLLSLSAVLWLYSSLHTPMSLPSQSVLWHLPAGATLGSASADLVDRGWMSQTFALRVYSRLQGRGGLIHSGEYALQSPLTPLQWLDKIERGEVLQYSITFPEGWSLRQVWQLIQQTEKLQSASLSLPQLERRLLAGQEYPSLEGWLFPDTYRFVAGSPAEQLLRRAQQQMQQLLAQEWEQRQPGLPYQHPYEALIMASLIEKETGLASERADIAGVFVRRLQRGMRLQTDPAVIYGLGAEFDGNLTRAHLRDSSNPWNTYRHHGLPPTPIAMPGREAVRAALQPAAGDSLYFVARGDGSHQFSATFAEHQQAVQQYQLQRSKDYRSSPTATAPASQQQE